MYNNNKQEELKTDKWKTIERYIKKIYEQRKFLSENWKQFERLNFVTSTINGKK